MLYLVKNMTRSQKQAVLLCVDLLLVPLALLFTLAVQGQNADPTAHMLRIWPVVGLLMVLAAALSTILRIPNTRLNAYDMSGVGKTAVFAFLLALAAFALGRTSGLDFTAGVYVVFGIVFFLFSAGSRVVMLQSGAQPLPPRAAAPPGADLRRRHHRHAAGAGAEDP